MFKTGIEIVLAIEAKYQKLIKRLERAIEKCEDRFDLNSQVVHTLNADTIQQSAHITKAHNMIDSLKKVIGE